jgi:hypothetical protein
MMTNPNDVCIEMHLGERFFKYKQDVNSMRSTVEQHFSHVINQIEAGLPDIVDDEECKDEDNDIFEGAKTWTCLTCTMQNQMA